MTNVVLFLTVLAAPVAVAARVLSRRDAVARKQISDRRGDYR